MGEKNVFYAFGVRDINTNEFKHDPSMVQFKGFVFEGNGSFDKIVHEIGVHSCTQDDLKRLYKPDARFKKKIASLLNKK